MEFLIFVTFIGLVGTITVFIIHNREKQIVTYLTKELETQNKEQSKKIALRLKNAKIDVILSKILIIGCWSIFVWALVCIYITYVSPTYYYEKDKFEIKNTTVYKVHYTCAKTLAETTCVEESRINYLELLPEG